MPEYDVLRDRQKLIDAMAAHLQQELQAAKSAEDWEPERVCEELLMIAEAVWLPTD